MASPVRKKFVIWLVLPIVSGALLWFGGQDIRPAWSAKAGGGTVGTFTADERECGRRSCSFYGDWVAGDGGSSRDDVILYDEPDGFRVGDRVEATDTGARKGVFATAGGYTYLLVTAMTAGGAIALIYWLATIVKAWRARAPRRRSGDGVDLFTLPQRNPQ